SVGGVKLGAGAPVSVQSMTNTQTSDLDATLTQIRRLESAGCEIVRVAIPDEASAESIGEIKKRISIPLVGDIHFNYKLALLSIKNGVDKLRINPGNIGAEWKVREIAEAAADKGIPLRIGVNAGSLPARLIEKYSHPCAEAMVEAAEWEIEILDKLNFKDIVVSLKASQVPLTLNANRLFAGKYDYPLHLGVTEAGFGYSAVVKSALGIGVLLEQGIGDTIRVSITGDPVPEVRVARYLLSSLGLKKGGFNLIACPTCARMEFPVAEIAEQLESRFGDSHCSLTVAVMGCVVNGPGEAREADIGITGSANQALLFVKGKLLKSLPKSQILDEMEKLIKELS
ncbi:flavodoxin-dependent (E)-4-hydroxy-3-methylbut-2-enyl-diphosphate synthase, partial [bacterium]|nr:flavodoxin-dependent (E)-4-hydroxy-3-methylbut-2-enyl-diphosphate synthase [bacterium]